ncbi:arcadin 1 [Candidatus Bathyarchaeota archaeon]|nr:arcadin 1 [Candidatus Bathyarchaeota archaeon]
MSMYMFRVRVNKIESIRDIDGNLGKRIELVEERPVPQFAIRPQTEEAKVVQEVFQALQQQIPMFPARAQFAVPKIILFLTEQEYESLGITFDVNQVYEITLENQAIKFRKTA